MVAALELQRQDYTQQAFYNLPPSSTIAKDTPGPHRLQQRAARQEDLEYKLRQEAQQRYEAAQQPTPTEESPNKAILNVFQSLTKVIANNNKFYWNRNTRDSIQCYGC